MRIYFIPPQAVYSIVLPSIDGTESVLSWGLQNGDFSMIPPTLISWHLSYEKKIIFFHIS